MTFSSSLPAPVQEHLQQIIQQYALYQSKVIRFNKRFLYEPMDIPLLKLTNLLKKFFNVGANEQTLKTKQRYDYIAIVFCVATLVFALIIGSFHLKIVWPKIIKLKASQSGLSISRPYIEMRPLINKTYLFMESYAIMIS